MSIIQGNSILRMGHTKSHLDVPSKDENPLVIKSTNRCQHWYFCCSPGIDSQKILLEDMLLANSHQMDHSIPTALVIDREAREIMYLVASVLLSVYL